MHHGAAWIHNRSTNASSDLLRINAHTCNDDGQQTNQASETDHGFPILLELNVFRIEHKSWLRNPAGRKLFEI